MKSMNRAEMICSPGMESLMAGVLRACDGLKNNCSEEDMNNGYVNSWFISCGIQLSNRDCETIVDFLRSSYGSVKEFLENTNRHLELEQNIPIPNQQYAVQGQILDTIHEETESSTTHSKVNDTIQNPFSYLGDSVTDNSSIPISNTAVPNDELSLEKPDIASVEYDTVTMIRMKRMMNDLLSMHRHVYFRVNSLTDDQLNEFVQSLQQQEEGYAELQGITIRDASKNDVFGCNFVVLMVWRLMGDGSKAGESKLFSSWKTKVNVAAQQVLSVPAIGFLDVLADGIYLYQ